MRRTVTLEELAAELGARKSSTTIDGRVAEHFTLGEDPPVQIEDTDVLVDHDAVLIGGAWHRARFLAASDSLADSQRRLRFERSHLHDCSLSGANIIPPEGEGPIPIHAFESIELSACEVDALHVTGGLGRIRIDSSSDVRNLRTEDCHIGSLEVQRVTLVQASIAGHFTDWSSDEVVFQRGFWRPEIERDSTLKKTVFLGTEVELEPLIQTCDDRRGVDISRARVNNDWTRLRDVYSGPRLTVVLLLTALYVAPYLVETAYYFATAKVSEALGKETGERQFLISAIVYGSKTGLARMLAIGFAALLLWYNVVRLLITLHVVKLREREEHYQAYGFRRFITPRARYALALRIDRWQSVAFWLVLAYSIWRLGEALFYRVPRIG